MEKNEEKWPKMAYFDPFSAYFGLFSGHYVAYRQVATDDIQRPPGIYRLNGTQIWAVTKVAKNQEKLGKIPFFLKESIGNSPFHWAYSGPYLEKNLAGPTYVYAQTATGRRPMHRRAG